MIKNVVFDMGGVILYYHRDYFLDKLALTVEDKKLLKKEVYMQLEWAGMDRGSLDEAQAYARVIKRLPARLHPYADHLINHWNEDSFPIAGIEELAQELKNKGYHLFVLSNVSKRVHQYLADFIDTSLFEGIIVSADEHLLKPQNQIYELLNTRYHLNLDETVFIDDSYTNVEAAIYYGLHGIIFEDCQQLKTQLKQLGVSVK